jgi:hypothetical protein
VRLALQIIAVLSLLANSAANAQEVDIRGKTIVYTMSKSPGQVYVAPSGNVYWAFQPGGLAKHGNWGREFKLGGSLNSTMGNCPASTSASLTGSTLTLDTSETCPGRDRPFVQHIVVTITGVDCRFAMRVSFAKAGLADANVVADSCQIVDGNQIPR